MKRYTIKPLVWEKYDTGYMAGERAETANFGSLSVETVVDEADRDLEDETPWVFSWCVDEYYDEGTERFASKEAAKARANEWYLQRIKGDLEEVQ